MTSIAEIGEFGLLAKINAILQRQPVDVLLPYGDDCTALRWPSDAAVISCDAMVEGSHFRWEWMTPEDLAWKSLAGAVSDLAAKGAEPCGALITLGLPGGIETKLIFDMYESWVSLDEPWSCPVLGGDTVRSPVFFVDVFVTGVPLTGSIIANHTARPGDRIFVTGTLGDARCGLEILQKGLATKADYEERFLINRFLRPVPRLAEVKAFLAAGVIPTAMSDISDGLARTLRNICERSGVGAYIRADDLPISEALRRYGGGGAARVAWEGGEDYELLLTLPIESRERALSVVADVGLSLSEIGKVYEATGQVDVDGIPDAAASGFDHFA